ncbi:MAG TPA: hypothetical protein VFO95_10510 [Gemmatimonadales bacterium]|nr:hypothetical protein [Gemmatimonadales bacterium]
MRRILGHGAIALAVIGGCTPTEPSSPLPVGAVAFAPPSGYTVWFDRTEGCAGLSGHMETIQWYVVPEVETFMTDQGEKVGMWARRGDQEVIIIAGNYVNHEMVVRHEMLHSLLGQRGHPVEYFEQKCQLTWETWAVAE